MCISKFHNINSKVKRFCQGKCFILAIANEREISQSWNERRDSWQDFHKKGQAKWTMLALAGIYINKKRLLLANLKELHSIFKWKYPPRHIGFSKFCSLCPKWCFLPGSSWTHSVCVCTHHQSMKLINSWSVRIKNLWVNRWLWWWNCQNVVSGLAQTEQIWYHTMKMCLNL